MRSGGRPLRVVVDTNIWFSGLAVPEGAPGQILRAIRDHRIDPVISWELADEVARTLRSPKLRRYRVAEPDAQDVLTLFVPFLPTVEFVGSVRDPNDVVVVEAALSGEAEAIVTGDRDLLDDEDLRRRLGEHGIRVLTARELLALLK